MNGGTGSHLNGISHTFTSSTPDYISFKIKSSTNSQSNSFVVIGDNPGTWNDGIIYIHMNWSGIIWLNFGVAPVSYVANQWYNIELMNIDFVAKTYDYFVDGTLISSGVSFIDLSLNSINEIHLYGFSVGQFSYFDDIQIGTTCSQIDTTLSYTWSPSTDLSNPNIYNPVASPANTTTYTVLAVGGGCASPIDSVTVYTTILNVNATASTSLICSGDTAQLNVSANIEGTTFLWSPATGLSCTNCPNPMASPASTTTYTVTGTSGSCTDVASVSITVSAGPVAPSCTPITTGYCCGMGVYNVTFNTINNTTADGIDGYQDYTCTDATDVIIDQTYSIFIQTGTGLQENVRVWIDYNNDGVFDNDSTTELVFWSDNVLTNHSGTITIPFTAVVNTPLRMRVASDYYLNSPPTPCSNVQYGQFEDYSVIILPNTIPPVANFSFNILDMCQGIVSFIDQSLYNPTSWFWDFGDGSGLSASQNPFYSYSLPGIYTVTLIVTNPYGSDTLSQLITINSLTADFTVSNDTVNIGVNVKFFDNSIGANSWNWDFGDGFSSIIQNTFHAYFSVGTYTVTLTVTNASGCIAQIVQQIVVIDCSVGPQTGTITGPVNVNESATEFYSVTFHVGSTYSWTIIGGNQTSGGTTNFISVQWGTTGSGQIIVFEIDSTGCAGDTVSLIVNIGPTGTFENEIAKQMNLYPNPNTGKFILEIYDLSPENSGYDCFIYNFLGREITKFKIIDQKTEIDLKEYAKGIYYLKVISDGWGVINRKVIIE